MFVLKSKYEKLFGELLEQHGRYRVLSDKYRELMNEHNTLIRKINAKGGGLFLDRGTIQTGVGQFSQAEIRTLISLSHPDKHGGKEAAQAMTRKLLSMRHTVQ